MGCAPAHCLEAQEPSLCVCAAYEAQLHLVAEDPGEMAHLAFVQDAGEALLNESPGLLRLQEG